VSAARGNLKEAGGKLPTPRTEIVYKAATVRRYCTRSKSLKLSGDEEGKDRGYMGGKRMNLPWEVCRRVIVKEQKSAEAIVGCGNEPSERMEVSQTTEGPNVRKGEGIRKSVAKRKQLNHAGEL
jgi:hypothetical protein